MKNDSVTTFGGWCGILIGMVTVLTGVAVLLLPADQQLGSPGARQLPSIAANPTMLILVHIGFTLVAVLGFGFIPALSNWVRGETDGLLRWTSSLAYLGYAVWAIASVNTISRLPRVAEAFVAGDASTKAALVADWRSSMDPYALWSFGGVGLFILVASWLALRGGRFAPWHSYLGVAVGILFLLVPIAFIFRITFLFTLVDVLGGILSAIWYFWSGQVMRGSMMPGTTRLRTAEAR